MILIEQCPTTMVDTGSAVTIVREDAWQEAVAKQQRRLTTLNRPVIAANSQELEILGQQELTLTIGGFHTPYPVLIARGIMQECLLGADFLASQGHIVNLQQKALEAGGQSVPLQFSVHRCVGKWGVSSDYAEVPVSLVKWACLR